VRPQRLLRWSTKRSLPLPPPPPPLLLLLLLLVVLVVEASAAEFYTFRDTEVLFW
jgi:hypothetical protein